MLGQRRFRLPAALPVQSPVWVLLVLSLSILLSLLKDAIAQGTLEEANRLNEKVMQLLEQGKYAEALPSAEQCLALRERLLGPDDKEVAVSLNNLATLYDYMGQYAKAEVLFVRAIEIRRRTLGENHPDYASVLVNLGRVYEGTSQYGKAEPLYLKASKILKQALGEDSPEYATCLNNLAEVYGGTGQYEKAEPLHVKAMAIRKKVLGEKSRDYAISLNNLAGLCKTVGRYDKAEPLYAKANEVWRTSLGEGHPDYATGLNNLGALYKAMGQYDKAVPLYERAMLIRKKAFGENSPDYAGSLNNLAVLYKAVGHYEKAEPLYAEAAELRRRLLGEEHPQYGSSLNNLARLYFEVGQYDKAEQLGLRAAAIRSKALGEDHPDYAQSLSNLALVYRAMGRYDKAEPLCAMALEIRRKAFGENHPDYTASLSNLGKLYVSRRQYTKAEPLYMTAERIDRNLLGENHPAYINDLNNLVGLYAATGRSKEALRLCRRASGLEEKGIERIFSFTSESAKLAYLAMIAGTMDAHLTLVRDAFPNDREAVAWALGQVLRRKGLVLESLLQQRRAMQHAPEVAAAFEDWRSLMRQLDALILKGPGKEGREHYESNLRALAARKEKVEGELSRLSNDFALEQRQRHATPETIAPLLPRGGALVEIVRVRLYDFRATDTEPRWLPAHYLAFLLSPGGQPVLLDLGEAEPIEKAVAEYRTALSASASAIRVTGEARAEKQLGGMARALYRLVFAPMQKHLKGATTLFLSPDGELNLIPFGALQDSAGKYLVETYAFNYVSSGRDLVKFGRDGWMPQVVRAQARATSGVRAVIIADPDFDLSAAARLAQAKRLSVKLILLAEAPTGNLRSTDLRTRDFKPLPGTAQEAKAVSALLETSACPIGAATSSLARRGAKGVKLYLGPEALEETVKALRSPGILHFATHGYFLADQDLTALQERQSSMARSEGWQRMAAAGVENPLLRSGLALSGANRFGKEETGKADDGLLTAQEISGLDLTGTDLVVLSACETGLGQVRTGEGVFGLRRAFLNAGAKTLLMSLTKVPDVETKDLIVEFYKRWLVAADKVKALHEAEVALLQKRRTEHGASHPLFWGAFIAMGDPR